MSDDNYCHDNPSLFYISENCPGLGCDPRLFSNQLIGCQCSSSCTPSSCPCMSPNPSCGWRRECGSDCACVGRACQSRVVQRGARPHLQVFDTGDARGLGLRTLADLPPGAFVCCYAGEVIGPRVAADRFSASPASAPNYILALHEHYGHDDETRRRYTTFIDATRVANMGRYVNHSCRPNMQLEIVRVDSLVPHAAMFTIRPVSAGEQLTYSYGASASWTGDAQIRCAAKRQKSNVSSHDNAVSTSVGDQRFSVAVNEEAQNYMKRVNCSAERMETSEVVASHESDGDCRYFARTSVLKATHSLPDVDEAVLIADDCVLQAGYVDQSCHHSLPYSSRTRCLCGEPECGGWLPAERIFDLPDLL